MAEATVIEKEMALTHADFFRLVPKAFPDGNFRSTADGIVRDEGAGRCLTVTLGPEGERRIALLSVATTPVTLTFDGYADEAIAETMVVFDRAFQKGGG